MISRFSALIITCLILAFTANALADNDFNVPPLFYNGFGDQYDYHKDFAGPFVTVRNDESRSEYGLRPLFFWHSNEERSLKELDVIYPLFTYWKKDNLKTVQFLLYLLRYDTEKLENGFTEREFTLFPFVFYRDALEDEEDHFGLFPVYGNLKNTFSKDEIKFILFPVYMKTRSGGDRTTSVLWPIFSVYSGDHDGIRIWPFYGKRTKQKNSLENEFVLWPFYVRNEKQFYGERVYSKSFFPFYSESEMFGIQNRTYFWPLFSKTENEQEGFERWDTPWPLVNVTRGKKYQTRFFPFFSRSESSEEDKDGFILWPLYKYSTIHLNDHTRYKKQILLFLFKDERYEPFTERGKSGRRIDMWPLFSYSDNGDTSYFHILTVFEPFLRSNERLYRNYAPFWRIFEWKKKEDDSSKASLLWDIVTFKRSGQGSVFSIKPIIPLLSVKDLEKENSVKILGGLLGFTDHESGEILHLLYYPFRFNNNE